MVALRIDGGRNRDTLPEAIGNALSAALREAEAKEARCRISQAAGSKNRDKASR
jgi:hypothetical protein